MPRYEAHEQADGRLRRKDTERTLVAKTTLNRKLSELAEFPNRGPTFITATDVR